MSSIRKELASILADLREVQPREWRFTGLFILALYLFLGWAFWVLPFPWGAIFAFLVLGGIIIYRTVYQAKSRRMLEAGLESAEELRGEVEEVFARVIEHGDELLQFRAQVAEYMDPKSGWLPRLDEMQASIEEIEKFIRKLTAPDPRYKAGRPRNPDDEWAYEQVRVQGRKPEEVYPEWRKRIGDRVDDLADLQDSFRKAIKPRR
ncbi:MAG: hypothetical protein FJ015_06665 [Chloroflexi bacterium]|nr:hypothetical protein [Chloroflexota bacterium]